jgi:6-phosphogluconolactonase
VSRFEIIPFRSDHDLAQSAAAQWLDGIQAANLSGQAQFVALSGGRIARDFFSAVASQSIARQIPLSNVHFFWADERCVPPEDAESNYAVARKLLFEPLSIAQAHIHRIRGEAPPEAAAAAATEALHQWVSSDSNGHPILDIVFLGMGEDGHIASLFPGAAVELVDHRGLYLPVTASKPPPLRISLNYASILAAKEVWVLVSGRGKETALAMSLDNPQATPLGRVIHNRNHSRIFTSVAIPKAGGF